MAQSQQQKAIFAKNKTRHIWDTEINDVALRGTVLEKIHPPTKTEKEKRFSLRPQFKNANKSFDDLPTIVQQKLIRFYKNRW